MSDDNEIVELKLDELNELLFRVKVVGADFPPNAFRLVCEDQALSYCFSGELTEEDDVVRFVIPPMEPDFRVLVQNEIEISTYVSAYFAPFISVFTLFVGREKQHHDAWKMIDFRPVESNFEK